MKKRLLIGIICAEPNYKRTGEVIEGIISQAFKCNCDIVVLSPLHNQQFEWNDFRKGERHIFNLAKSEKIDGFLYDRRFLYNKNVEEYIDKILISTQKPVMMIDGFEHKVFDNTAAEDRRPFEKLIEHLIEVHEYKKIYCLTGPKNSHDAVERLNGYFDAMQKHNLYYDDNYFFYGDFWKQSAYELADKIARKEIEIPDAVACGNDVTATAFIDKIEKYGYRVPEDIAVVGFDYSCSGEFNSDEDVTSYKRDNFQLGADSFRRLYRAITGSIPSRVIKREEGLVVGYTCGCSRKCKHNNKDIRRINNTQRFIYDMLYRDLIMEAESTNDIYSALNVVTHYTYCLYKYKSFSICLKESFLNELNGTDICSNTLSTTDKMKTVLKNYSSGEVEYSDNFFFVSDILPDYEKTRSKPSAYFISPLNSMDRFFGYSAISFGKNPYTYDKAYISLILYINNIFEFFRNKALLENKSNALNIDSITNLPYFQNETDTDNTMFEYKGLFSIEISDFRTELISNSTDEFDQKQRQFIDFLKSISTPEERLFIVNHGLYVILTKQSDFGDRINNALKIKNSFISPFSFTIGTKEINNSGNLNFREILRHSMMNTVLTYSPKKSISSNALFKKLCLLNEEMKASPQDEWSIDTISDSLHLSKSYLQKIYKSYFGVGIIENLIKFRIDLAKSFLIETDMSITEISEKCGYSSYIYFTKQFKKSTGETPSEFRKNHSVGEQ